MLQCTAVTQVPYAAALLALSMMEGGPVHPPDVLDQDDFLLCELADHDETAEHAAHLWTADVPDDRDLWFRWSGTGAHRLHRLDTLRLCPAVLLPRHGPGLSPRCGKREGNRARMRDQARPESS